MSDTEFGDQAAQIATRIRDLRLEDQIAAACPRFGQPGRPGVDRGEPAIERRIDGRRPRGRARRAECLDAGEIRLRRGRRRAGGTGGASRGVDVRADRPWSPRPTGRRSPPTRSAWRCCSAWCRSCTNPHTVLGEARRVAGALGLMDYCSTGPEPVCAGGSTFLTQHRLREVVSLFWRLGQFAAVSVEAPRTWVGASDDVQAVPNPDETEVMRAIDDGRIAPIMLVASR